jgi:uncharacterized HhH-GPD family protein
MNGTLRVTGDPDADRLLNTDPLALLLGMMLDQQVPMEWAFQSPLVLRDRLEGRLDAREIAAADPDDLVLAFKGPPALHRFPGSMAKRTQEMCRHLVEHHDGRAEAIWDGVDDPAALYQRIRALPGFGDDKTRIFLALLGKRFDLAHKGWEELAGPFGDATPRSVADVDSVEALQRVREFKKAQKAKGKTKAE